MPGIGKSRLVAELGQAVADDEEIITWRYGRCLPYGEGVTFWALGEIVKAQAGIHENDTAEAAEHKLAAMVDELVPEATGAGSRRACARSSGSRPRTRLSPTGVPSSPPAGGRSSSCSRSGGRSWSCSTTSSGRTTDCSSSSTSSRSWSRASRCSSSAARGPSSSSGDPTGAEASETRSRCRSVRCSRAETEKLVESLLGRDPADDVLRASVVERAAGNPLYAEEFVRMQASGGATSELPDSVLGIVAARVDLLPPAEKELLRDAAVMGTVVWSDGLRAVSGRDGDEDVGGLLRSLGRKEFLRRERQSAVAGATQHAFVHGLVRDAVYAQLPRPDRVERHVRVARWIETLPEDRREDRSELLAHHYVQAIELSRSAGLDAAELAAGSGGGAARGGAPGVRGGRAPGVRSRAAGGRELGGRRPRRAGAAGARQGTRVHRAERREELLRAFELFLGEGSKGGAAAVAVDIAHSFWQHGDGLGAAEWAARGVDLIEGEPPSRRPCSRPRAGGAARDARGRTRSGRPSSPTARSRSRRRSAPRRLGRRALITKATSRANAGDYENVREDLEEARRLTTEYDPTEVSRAYVNLSSILLDFGELADAIAVAREGLAHNVRAGTAGGTGGFALGNLCEACFFAGQWEEAEAIANAELERARKVGGLYYEPFFRFILAELGLVRSGRVDEAVAAVRLGVELGYARGDDQSVFPSLATAAWTLARTGSADEARRARRRAPRPAARQPSGRDAGVLDGLRLACVRARGRSARAPSPRWTSGRARGSWRRRCRSTRAASRRRRRRCARSGRRSSRPRRSCSRRATGTAPRSRAPASCWTGSGRRARLRELEAEVSSRSGGS